MDSVKKYLRAVPVAPLVLTAALIASSAAGQNVDAKGGRELAELGQKIDKTADRAAPDKVVDKVAAQFSGDQFACDNKFVNCVTGTNPGTKTTLTSSQLESLVKTLRAGSPSLGTKGLGFGEISILLALASQNTMGKSVSDILTMRQSGEGWGDLARDLGFKNLGSVIKSVKAAEKGVDRVALERSDKREDRLEKADKPEKPEKVERMERPERPMRPERPGR